MLTDDVRTVRYGFWLLFFGAIAPEDAGPRQIRGRGTITWGTSIPSHRGRRRGGEGDLIKKQTNANQR